MELQVAELSVDESSPAISRKPRPVDITTSGDENFDLMESALETEMTGRTDKDAAEARLAAEEMLYRGWRLAPDSTDVGESGKDVEHLFENPSATAVQPAVAATGALMEGCTYVEAVEANSTCADSSGTCTYTPLTFSPVTPPSCNGTNAAGDACALHEGVEAQCNGGSGCKLDSNGTSCALARTECPNVMDPEQAHVCSNSTGAEICEDRTCTTWAGMYATHCNKDESWRNNTYCARSCFEHGVGYDGDQCQVFTATPTATPTSAPTRAPTTLESLLPPISQCFDDPKWKDDCMHVKEHCLRSVVMKARCRRTCGCGPKVEVYIPTEDEKPFIPPTSAPTPAPTAYMDPPDCTYTGVVEANTQCVVDSGNCSFTPAVESPATCTGPVAENCTMAVARNATEASCEGDKPACASFSDEDECTESPLQECSWNPGSPGVAADSECAVTTGNCTYAAPVSSPATCGNGTDAKGQTCAVHLGAEPTCSGGTHCGLNAKGSHCLEINHLCNDQTPPQFNNTNCSTYNDLAQNYCLVETSWIENKYCQHTCWEKGAGYPGDWCHPLYAAAKIKAAAAKIKNSTVVVKNNSTDTNSTDTNSTVVSLASSESQESPQELGEETEQAEEADVAEIQQLAQDVSQQANKEAAQAAKEDATNMDLETPVFG